MRGVADFEMDDEQRHEGTSTHFSPVASRDKTHLVRGREGSRGESCYPITWRRAVSHAKPNTL